MYSILCPWAQVMHGADKFSLSDQNIFVDHSNLKLGVFGYDKAKELIKKGKVTVDKNSESFSISNMLKQSGLNRFLWAGVEIEKKYRSPQCRYLGTTIKFTKDGCESNCNCYDVLGVAHYGVTDSYRDDSAGMSGVADICKIDTAISTHDNFHFKAVCAYRIEHFYILRTLTTNGKGERYGVSFAFYKDGNPVAVWGDTPTGTNMSNYRVADKHESEFIEVYKTLIV